VQRFSEIGNPNLGFIDLDMIQSEAAHQLQRWFQHGDRSLHLDASRSNVADVVRMIHLSSLAHILDIPKLQTAAKGALSRHFDDAGNQPTPNILRAMWKATRRGCPYRELLLHNRSIYLNTLGQNARAFELFMRSLREEDQRMVDLRGELRNRVNDGTVMTLAPGRTNEVGRVTWQNEEVPDFGPDCELQIADRDLRVSNSCRQSQRPATEKPPVQDIRSLHERQHAQEVCQRTEIHRQQVSERRNRKQKAAVTFSDKVSQRENLENLTQPEKRARLKEGDFSDDLASSRTRQNHRGISMFQLREGNGLGNVGLSAAVGSIPFSVEGSGQSVQNTNSKAQTQPEARKSMRSLNGNVNDRHDRPTSTAGKHVIDLTISDDDENDTAERGLGFKAGTLPNDGVVGKAGSKRKEAATQMASEGEKDSRE
jgi:hypothetical protein